MKGLPAYDLEIGAGDGFHALARAAAFPNRQIIAIEKTRSRFQKLIRRIELQGRAPQRRASQRTGAAQPNLRQAGFRRTASRRTGNGPQTFRRAAPAGDFPAGGFSGREVPAGDFLEATDASPAPPAGDFSAPAGAAPQASSSEGLPALADPARSAVLEPAALESTALESQDPAESADATGAPPPNFWPLQTNAVWYLAHYGRKGMFENIFLLYPNPWPKRKQSNKRWVNRPFMTYLLTLLKPGGLLEMRTDQGFYYREFREKIVSFKGMRIERDFIVPPGAPPVSAFEKKYLHQGRICRVLCCTKTL